MSNKNNTIVRIPAVFYHMMRADLSRPHPFAAERVGFFTTSFLQTTGETDIITVTGYHTVPDQDYINDQSVGASINAQAIRREMQAILTSGHGCFHVHMHDHPGKPGPSFTDKSSLPDVSRSFLNASPVVPCGYLIVSRNDFYCAVFKGEKSLPALVNQLTVVGYPTNLVFNVKSIAAEKNEIFDRQTFLGPQSSFLFNSVRVGLVGIGGGGSHFAQQLAHLGFTQLTSFDADHIEWSNLNRLVGGRYRDIKLKLKKTAIAERMIKAINPFAKLRSFTSRWQDKPAALNQCDFVIGCVDSLDERLQLESACRKALIPYIDIGMDVHDDPGHGYSMSGQVILSMPGMPCMQCFGFITPDNLTAETKKYGNAGGRPQVVWPNGVLASTGIGVLVDLITGWTNIQNRKVYLSYDGDLGHITDHPKGIHCPANCIHHPLDKTGEVIFKAL